MISKTVLLFLLGWTSHVVLCADLYDVYFGNPITGKRRDYLDMGNGTLLPQCTILVEKCNKDEGRRVDATCNNLHHPTRGAARSPLMRFLPALYGPNNDLRSGKSGEPLPPARVIRTSLLSDGLVTSPPFSQLASHFFVTATVDLSYLSDLLTYAVVSDCCLGNTPNRVNPRCIPLEVPADDPYLRLTGIRCLNMTRAGTFQDFGCIPNTLPRERFNPTTPILDLSMVYGMTNLLAKSIRQYKGGLLKVEERANRTMPPSNSLLCINNRQPVENRCYEYGDQLGGNVLLGTNLITLWFYREHNRIASRLAKVNPCWDDQKLFEIARTINIAQYQQIYYYELIPALIGKKNALQNGIIFETKGYVNDYDERLEPGSYHEFIQGTRWFHTFQDARTNTYTQKGKYTGFRPTVEDEFRSGVLEVDDTIEQLTQGSFRQESAKFDQIFDPDLTERLYGNAQSAADLISIDIQRSRDLGLRTYNDYRQFCGLPKAKKFQDFLDVIDVSRVEIMSRLYEDPDDVDIIAGIYSEKFIEGGWTGPTLYCIMVRQWLHWRRSDRFWYEHSDQKTSLTIPQLYEIRKASISRVICDNGDGVQKIQPQSLYRPMLGNPIIPCEQIEGADYRAWQDEKCIKEKDGESNGYKQENYGIYGPASFSWNGYESMYGQGSQVKEDSTEQINYDMSVQTPGSSEKSNTAGEVLGSKGAEADAEGSDAKDQTIRSQIEEFKNENDKA